MSTQPNLLPLAAIHLNDANPRLIKDDRFDQLVQSLIDFPEMLTLRPTVVDEAALVLGGNMRMRAVLHLKALPEKQKEGRIEHAVFHRGLRLDSAGNTLEEATAEQKEAYRAALQALLYEPTMLVTQVLTLTEAQKKEFIIKDNHGFGENDWEALANGDWGGAELLNSWGMDVPKDWGEEPSVLAEIALPDGDKPAFKQITFTLTDLQAQEVETALRLAKDEEVNDFEGTGNENSNGNALAAVVAEFISARNG